MNSDSINLISQALDGSISNEDFNRLQVILRADPKTLAYYCQQSEIHGRLTWELNSIEPDVSLTQVKKSLWKLLLPPVAAALIVGFFSYVIMRPEKEKEEIYSTSIAENFLEEINIARITNSVDPIWEKDQQPIGSWLKPGVLTLHSGKAEITFDSGARVLLEGPATIENISSHHAIMLAGKSVVHIPTSASGFDLETPSNTFSDQDCSFALAVDETSTEILVIRGSIDTNPKDDLAATTTLNESQSLRLSRSENLALHPLKIDALTLDKELPELTEGKAAEFVHWSFDSVDNETFAETGTHPYDRFEAVSSHWGKSKGAYGVHSVKGKFGRAIRLYGDGSYLKTKFPGISGLKERTVACWVRVPRRNKDKHAYSIVSWGTTTKGNGQKWQISWDIGRDGGSRGALRTEFGEGSVSGSKVICDASWYHIVSVYRPNNSKNVASQVLHYINGKLDTTSSVRHAKINTNISNENAHQAYIGKRLEGGANFSTFVGSIDELYVFPAALTPRQISKLYKKNEAPSNFIRSLATQ